MSPSAWVFPGADAQVRARRDSQLLPGVERAEVQIPVKLGADVLQGTVVPKRPPLGVDAHPPLVAFHQVNVPQLLHVTRVGAGA